MEGFDDGVGLRGELGPLYQKPVGEGAYWEAEVHCLLSLGRHGDRHDGEVRLLAK